jgi:hypothetical protein
MDQFFLGMSEEDFPEYAVFKFSPLKHIGLDNVRRGKAGQIVKGENV